MVNLQKPSPDLKTYNYYIKVQKETLLAMTRVSLILLIVTFPITLLRNDMILTGIHLILTGFIFMNVIFIKKFGNLLLAVLTIILPSYCVLLYSLFIGNSDTISWFFIFPVLSFFFLGKKIAFWVNCMFLVSLFTVLVYRIDMLPEGYISILITCLTYATITLLSYFFEANREGMQKQLMESSMIDYLTGCSNRRAFDRDLSREIESATRYNKNFSIILLDVDQFKEINDNFGHVVGDIVLRELTENLRQNLRYNDTLYRLGGDEFIILLPNTDLEGVSQLGTRILDFIRQAKFSIIGKLTISAGVTQFIPGQIADSIIQHADKALYKAKKSGKNRIEIDEKYPQTSEI